MLFVEVIPIVVNGQYQQNNQAKQYLRQELAMSNAFSKTDPGNMFCAYLRGTSILDPALETEEIKQHKGNFLREAASFIGRSLTSEEIDNAYKANYKNSENPLWEAQEIFRGLAEEGDKPTQEVAMLQLVSTWNGRAILASIMVLTDSRITLDGKQVCYFIGIRKSLLCVCLQQIGFYRHTKVSAELIPAVTNWASEHNCQVLATTPLENMVKILTTYHNFSYTPNQVKASYTPPNIMISHPLEMCAWKSL